MTKIPDWRIWVEVQWRYDGISHREDKKWNKYSRNHLLPMKEDELCRYWMIYVVEAVSKYSYKVISEREDALPIN